MSTPLIQTTSEYNPQEQIAVTMAREQWDDVLRWLKHGADYHHAKMHEWLCVCDDKRMAQQIAGQHRQQMERAEMLYKIVEAVLWPQPAPETETP